MTRILSLNSTIADETVHLTTEGGATITAHVIASDAGHTIAQYDDGERWHAIEVVDYGDGDAELLEHAEGDTFGVTCQDEYIVRRMDSAGSLRWKQAD